MSALDNQTFRRLLLVAGAALLVLPGSSLANEWAEPGAYLTLGAINSFEHFDNTGEDFDNSWGFAARGGYRVNEWLAVEGFLEFISGYEVDYIAQPPVVPAPAEVELTIDGGMGGANAKLYAPWLGRLQPYALVGVGGQWARLRTTNPTGFVCDPIFWYCQGTYTKIGNSGAFVAKFGAGIDFWLSEDLAIVVDGVFNLPTGDLKDLRSTNLTWGAVFRF